MARKTLSTLRTEIRNQWLLDTDSASYETTDIALNYHIQDNHLDLMMELGLDDMSFLINTSSISTVTTDPNLYDVPDTFIGVISLNVTDSDSEIIEILPLDERDIERLKADELDDTCRDEDKIYWCLHGNKLRIYPPFETAGLTMMLRYTSVPTELTTGSSQTQIVQSMLGVLKVRTAMDVKVSLGDPIDDLTKIANEKMRRCFKLVAKRQLQQPKTIKSIAGFYPRQDDGGLY